jgi:protein-L-isoaspartate(D-aspartate) O-methyltransferase
VEPFAGEREALAAAVTSAIPNLPPPVREALRQIPRHLFAPESHLSFAYQNRSLPLGDGKLLPAPGDLARIASLLNLTREDRVLIIGSSAGYGAELFSLLGAEVVLMEEDDTERERMKNYMDTRIPLAVQGNLTLMPGWSPETLETLEPFDAVFIHGGVTEIPRSVTALARPEAPLAALLKGEAGSSLLVIMGQTGSAQAITVHGDMFFPFISDWNRENR